MKRKSIFLILFTLLLCNYYLVNACTIKPNFDLAGQCNPSSIYYDEVSCEHQTYMLNNLNEQCNSGGLQNAIDWYRDAISIGAEGHNQVLINGDYGGSFGCDNGAMFHEVRITYEYYNQSCLQTTYTCGRIENWGNCEVNMNDKTCTQKVESYTEKRCEARGYLSCTNTYENGVYKGSSCSGCSGASYTPAQYPSRPFPTNTANLTFSANTNLSGNAQVYANDRDQYQINIIVNTDRLINNKQISGFGNLSWIGSNVMSNIIDGSGTGALTLQNPSVNGAVYPNSSLTTLNLTSVTPFDTSEGQIKFTLGGANMVFDNLNLKFLKPFIGDIEVENPTTGNWDGKVTLGTLSKYRLAIKRMTNITLGSQISISDDKEDEFKNTIKKYGEDADIITLTGTKLLINSGSLKYDYNTASSHNIEFETRITTLSGAIKIPEVPGLQVDKATISYKLGNKDVKYYLSPTYIGDKITPQPTILKIKEPYSNPITEQGGEFQGVRVIGGIQGGGNSEFTGQSQNISNISSMEARTHIRKNAYTYINSMKNGDIVNGVRYVEGDVELQGEPDYETLVVKNGNVIIRGHLNTNNKVFGIIVLKDGYSVTEDWKNSGNVYVTPGVQKVNAIIYADGGFISIQDYINKEAILYESDSTTRTQQLGKQLYMNGSLFTRNTIGGAILANQIDEKYTLPGGAKTLGFDIALQYDLNYVRRGKGSCENAGGEKNPSQTSSECIYNEPFIIKYDPRVQTTPPKLFGN